jgi:DNA-binding transcriptional LysR family regulator
MNFNTLDLNLLRIFDVIMAEQNLTRAADRLATTQPAVSNALKRLRETVDDELLTRSARGMRPTARAEALWPAVRLALSTLESAMTPDTFDISQSSATFRIAMADSTAALLLPALMAAIKREAPNLNMRLVPLASRDPRPALVQGDIDLAIGSFPGVVAQMKGDQGSAGAVSHQCLYASEYVCVMRKDHPLAQQELDLDAYCGALHALLSFSGRALGPADEVLEKMGRKRRIALTVNQFFTLFQIVARSDLISIVPRHLIKANGMSDLVIVKPVPFALPIVQVDMLWHERESRSPVHRWLRNTLGDIPVSEVVEL